MRPLRRHVVDSEPLLRPSPDELSVAPALGVLAALDATLATAAYQLHAEHPELTPEVLARGDMPSTSTRTASLLIFRCADLRAAIREYRARTLGPDSDDHAERLYLDF
jgi:hypothetical protein